jgi:site-specific DNA-methyltransferase (adenine-specific)
MNECKKEKKGRDLNVVYCDNWLNNNLPDKCANLLICDPPYYKVKGEFDFIWKTFDDYLADVEKWAIECKRVLADNGTLFWYGSAKNIAYAQIIFDKHFTLINNLVWNKGSFMGLEESEGLRSFAPCTERILMYGIESKNDNLGYFYEGDRFALNYIKDECRKIGITTRKQYDVLLNATNKSQHHLSESHFRLIKEDDYNLLKLKSNGKAFLMSYNDFLSRHNSYQRAFNNIFNLQEVLNFSNEQAKTGAKYDHDTVKPEQLTRALILTCSRKGDLVVMPFAGSGTECAMSAKEGRNFIGFDIEQKHVDTSNKRCQWILRQPQLF